MTSAQNIRAGRAYVELGVDDKMRAGLAKAKARLKAFGASAQAAGMAMAGVGAAVLAPVGFAVKTFADFSDQMSKVGAVTGSTAAQMDTLTEKAKELGRTTSFTASQVAAAMVELGRAGFRPQEIDAAISDMLNLARATDTELASAADIAGAALRGFGLEAEQMGRVADVLTTAANKSATTLTDLGEGMKMVAPLAVEAGLDIVDVAAAMGVLANNGIKGTLAGTALARALKNLATPQAQGELSAVGVAALDAAGNIRPLAQIIGELGKATREMGSGQRLAIFESLFGRGQAAALKLASSTKSLADLTGELNNATGAAAKTASAMDDNLGGATRRLLSAVEGVKIAIGSALDKTLQAWGERLTETAGNVTRWVKEHQAAVVMTVKLAAGLVAAGAALIAVGLAAKVAAFAIGGYQAAVAIAATATKVYRAVIISTEVVIKTIVATTKALTFAIQTSTAAQIAQAGAVRVLGAGYTALGVAQSAVSVATRAVVSSFTATAAITTTVAVGLGLLIAKYRETQNAGKALVAQFRQQREEMLLLDEQRRKLSEATGAERIKAELDAAIKEEQRLKNIMADTADAIMEASVSKRTAVGALFFGDDLTEEEKKKVSTLNQLLENQQKALLENRDKIKALRGELEKLGEDGAGGMSGLAGREKSKEELRRERDELFKLAELEIMLNERGEQKAIRLIDLRYQKEIEAAKAAGHSTDRLMEARELEIRMEREKNAAHRRELENEANKRGMEADKMRAKAERDQIFELRRLRINLQSDGLDAARELLAIEKEIAIEAAKANGERLDLIEKEFDLRERMLNREHDALKELRGGAADVLRRQSVGTFSGQALGQIAGTSTARMLKANEETAKNTREIKKNTRELQAFDPSFA